MTIDRVELERTAAALGFRTDSLEKVFRLLSLLDGLRSHPYLRPRIALKGGTALNLFLFDVPRLSVDIDLNYVGAVDRATMLAEKPMVEQAMQAVFGREGLSVRRIPTEHAGGKWILGYAAASGGAGSLEVDLNYMLRAPLWPVVTADSRRVGWRSARDVPVLELHELAAGKLAALCARTASRDVFDARELLRRTDLDLARLRLAFVVYGGLNREDWRTISVDSIRIEAAELRRELVPMLAATVRPAARDVDAWAEGLVAETRARMAVVLPLVDGEREFIERLNRTGEIDAALLTDDPALRARIEHHPGLRWKAQNVREHVAGGRRRR